jgi:DNA-binding MarR family transcriptional regulator
MVTDEFENSLNTLLVEVFNYILRYEETSIKAVSGASLTVNEAHMLEAVGKLGDSATMSLIASAMGIAAPTATVAIKKMEKKGFVLKEASLEDARCSIVRLTDLGKRLNRAHQLFHRSMVRDISRRLCDDERAALLSAITSLREFFSGKVRQWE